MVELLDADVIAYYPFRLPLLEMTAYTEDGTAIGKCEMGEVAFMPDGRGQGITLVDRSVEDLFMPEIAKIDGPCGWLAITKQTLVGNMCWFTCLTNVATIVAIKDRFIKIILEKGVRDAV